MADKPLSIPPTAPHTHTVVFLHGRGDNAQDFSSSLSHSVDSAGLTLYKRFPSFRWVFPQAARRECAAAPGCSMTQWFDIWDVRDFSNREGLQAAGLAESVSLVRGILADEAAALGGRWDRIILAGISQGAATSVHTLINLKLSAPVDGAPHPPRLGAFLGFSCRMPFPGRTLSQTRKILNLPDVPEDDALLRNTPMLLEHCVDDPLVLVDNGRALRDTLRGFGADVRWKEYPSGGHWFNSPAGICDAVSFLHEVLEPLGAPKSRAHVCGLPIEMDLS